VKYAHGLPMALFFQQYFKSDHMNQKPTQEEIDRVFNWLEFRDIKALLVELLSKYRPTHLNLINSINAWGEELPPRIVKQELLLLLSNLLPLYELICQPEVDN